MSSRLVTPLARQVGLSRVVPCGVPTIARLTILGLSVSLLGCKGGSPPPSSECQPLGNYLAKPAGVTLDEANATMVLGRLCEIEQWPAEARGCLRGAKDRAAIDACAARGMTPDKAQRLAGRLDALVAGGKAAAAAGRFDDVPGAPGYAATAPRPPPTCDGIAGTRLAAAMGVRLSKDVGSAHTSDVETITGLVTFAVCQRDAWPVAVLACARDAGVTKGALDPCVAMLSEAEQGPWGRQIGRAVAIVDAAITAGSAGATWSGTLAP